MLLIFAIDVVVPEGLESMEDHVVLRLSILRVRIVWCSSCQSASCATVNLLDLLVQEHFFEGYDKAMER